MLLVLLMVSFLAITAPEFVSTVTEDDGHCVFRGCGQGDAQIPCVFDDDQQPRSLNSSSSYVLLATICPDLVDTASASGSRLAPLCCDDAQVREFVASMEALHSVLGRCPSCFFNVARIFCELTCSPRQSYFMRVTNFTTVETTDQTTASPVRSSFTSNVIDDLRGYPVVLDFNQSGYHSAARPNKDSHRYSLVDYAATVSQRFQLHRVQSVDFFMADHYIDLAYASCAEVQSPSTSSRALSLICGGDGMHCSPRNLLKFMGSSPYPSPFSINFRYDEPPLGLVRFDRTVVARCDQPPVNGSSAVCGCVDCSATCPPYPLPPISCGTLLWGVDAWFVYAAGMFVVLVASFSIAAICANAWSADVALSTQWRGLASTAASGADFTRINEEQSQSDRQNCLKVDDGSGSTPSVDGVYVTPDMDGAPADQPTEDAACSMPSIQDTGNSSLLNQIFAAVGFKCASHPLIVIFFGLVFCVISNIGHLRFKVVTDPVELWAVPGSIARQQRDYYNRHLGPFYRVEQVIVANRGGLEFNYTSNVTNVRYVFGPVFEQSFLVDVLRLQSKLTKLWARSDDGQRNVTLDTICFAPLRKNDNLGDESWLSSSPLLNRTTRDCVVQSALNWFQNNETRLLSAGSRYLDHVIDCVNSPTLVPKTDSTLGLGCLSDYGGATFDYVALGANENDTSNNVDSNVALRAPALVITFLVNNALDDTANADARAWERVFVNFMKNFSHPNMSVAFSTESSVTDELASEARADVLTLAASYAAMFVYVSVALGRRKAIKSTSSRGLFACCSHLLVDSQIALGGCSVLLVLLSVASSIGVYSAFGVPSTLIIFEVVPFLVLAVGVDNVFILVEQVQRTARFDGESAEEHIGRALATVGPSMLLAAAAECTCFFLGALTDMFAVRVFAMYAAFALLINFVLQMTVFVAFLALDLRRQDAQRLDIFCCFRSATHETDITEPYCSGTAGSDEEGCLQHIVRGWYAPLLRLPAYRHTVLIGFLGWLCLSCAVLHKLDVGLDQDISMPRGSYLQTYFHHVKQYLRVGPPVYFVVRDGFDYANAANQNLLGAFSGSDGNSLVNQIQQASRSANRTFIASTAMSWLDDYFAWTASCCLENNITHMRCYKKSRSSGCISCPQADIANGRPQQFFNHIADFLTEIPDETCPKAGRPAYRGAVELFVQNSSSMIPLITQSYRLASKTSSKVFSLESSIATLPSAYAGSGPTTPRASKINVKTSGPASAVNSSPFTMSPSAVALPFIIRRSRVPKLPATESSPVAGNLTSRIGASSFMSFHTVLRGSSDYINALRMARYVADRIESVIRAAYVGQSSDVKVFPYSVFYVFYEQYLTIWKDTAIHLLLSFAGVFVITFLLMQFKFLPTLAICVTIGLIVVNVMGAMYFADISLNTISLVNLVMCVGISVEFCAHIVKAFCVCQAESSVEGAVNALVNTGTSVLSGITFTKLVGVAVLAFSKSLLFVVFYFRMYLLVVLIGFAHGLIFLPALLATYGWRPTRR